MLGFGMAALYMTSGQECSTYGAGNPQWNEDPFQSPTSKDEYHRYLKSLDVKKLYDVIVDLMRDSKKCWPADGPQDGDVASYAGLFNRLAWHCSGTLRVLDGKSVGGCEGGKQRFWPEREWRDNANLDHARAILAQVKMMEEYRDLSWGDLITFAGTATLKASGGPVNKFCFGRLDEKNGEQSIMLGTEGITLCPEGIDCKTDSPCPSAFHYDEQDPKDDPRCNLVQPSGRLQASHSVGLIYVYPHGPQLKRNNPEFNATAAHQRSPRLSALEVRDTFENRMGWTAQETVVLIGGGHTLGRAHGNCASKPGPDCKGVNTSTAGYEGPWTRTPSKWNYDFFDAILNEDWVASKSPDGEDQWNTASPNSKYAKTFKLTSDLSLAVDPIYRAWAVHYQKNPDLFDKDYADAWYKLVHRSGGHPHEDDLEKDAGKCTFFDFVNAAQYV